MSKQHLLKIQRGCYRVEAVCDPGGLHGHVGLGVLCDAAATLGHYISLRPEDALQLCQFLCEHIPGLSDSLKENATHAR